MINIGSKRPRSSDPEENPDDDFLMRLQHCNDHNDVLHYALLDAHGICVEQISAFSVILALEESQRRSIEHIAHFGAFTLSDFESPHRFAKFDTPYSAEVTNLPRPPYPKCWFTLLAAEPLTRTNNKWAVKVEATWDIYKHPISIMVGFAMRFKNPGVQGSELEDGTCALLGHIGKNGGWGIEHNGITHGTGHFSGNICFSEGGVVAFALDFRSQMLKIRCGRFEGTVSGLPKDLFSYRSIFPAVSLCYVGQKICFVPYPQDLESPQ